MTKPGQEFTTHMPETHDSLDEMFEALRRHNEHAMETLHPNQRALTYGDYWVRFVDLDATPPLVEFGHVFTREQVAVAELGDDADWDAVEFTIKANDHRMIEQGIMFGIAHSRLNPAGELGTTHKASVWPIEDRLFAHATDVGFDVTQFNILGRHLLTIAFGAMRAHVVPAYREEAK